MTAEQFDRQAFAMTRRRLIGRLAAAGFATVLALAGPGIGIADDPLRVAPGERPGAQILLRLYEYGGHRDDSGEGSDPRHPMERSIPGAYKVGGRHMSEPTGPVRDSSLRDR